MNSLLRRFRSFFIFSFSLWILFSIIRGLYFNIVPILIFVIVLKVLSKFKVNKKSTSNDRKVEKNNNEKSRIIDAEFEDVE